MGLGDFWNKNDTNKILDWYGTTVKKATSESDQYGDGVALTYAATVGIAGSTCFDSEDCGSGFACIGGQCALVDPNSPDATGGGSTAGCGGTGGSGGAPGGGGGGCGAGTGGGGGTEGSGCTKTGAGDCGSSGGGGGGGGADDCCGNTRCCRGGGCSCGPCPPPNNCSQYCAAEKSSTGDSGPGCGSGNECDECSECKQGGEDDDDASEYKCRPREGGPCNCPNGRKCGDCQSCNENGSCVADGTDCLTCCTCSADCPCGKSVQRRICVPYQGEGSGYSGLGCSSICRLGLDDSCDEVCPPPPDGGNPEPCDCNCSNDCGDCEICNAAGVCVPDPACNCQGDEECPVCQECDGEDCQPKTTSGGTPLVSCYDEICCVQGQCHPDPEQAAAGRCCKKRWSSKPYIYTCLNSISNCVQGSFVENGSEGCCIDACTGETKCRGNITCTENYPLIETPQSQEAGDCCRDSLGIAP